MIDEKVLIAEINKRIKVLKNKKKEIHSKAWDWSIDAEINDYKSILSFIGSLQEEHVVEQNLSNVQRNGKERKEPVSEDLEEAAEKAAVETFFVSPKWTEIRKELFKAGANWQKEQIAKENMLLPFKEYDNLMESINRQKKEGYEAGYNQGLKDSKNVIEYNT